MTLSRPFKEIVEHFRFPRLSHPGGRWPDVLGFMPEGGVPTLPTSDLPKDLLRWLRSKPVVTAEIAVAVSIIMCSVMLSGAGMFRAVHPQESLKVDVELCHIPVWAYRSTFY